MAENLDVNLNKNCKSHDLFSQRDTSEFESFREVADHELDHWLFAINKSKIRFLLDGKIKVIGHGDGREIRNQRNKRVYFLWFALNVGLNCKECRARYRYKFQIERESGYALSLYIFVSNLSKSRVCLNFGQIPDRVIDFSN